MDDDESEEEYRLGRCRRAFGGAGDESDASGKCSSGKRNRNGGTSGRFVEGVDAPYETESSASETGKHTKTQWEQDEEAKVVKERATKPTHTWEIQAEYLEGRFFKERHIDDYNIHIYRKYRDVNDISVWYGGTLSRPVGYTTEDGIYRDSEAIGLGPSMMLRWERPLVGKLSSRAASTARARCCSTTRRIPVTAAPTASSGASAHACSITRRARTP